MTFDHLRPCLYFIVLLICCLSNTTNAQITNWITVGTNRYATIDNVNPINGTATSPCDNVNFKIIPTGWTLATVSESTHQAIWAGSWVTWGLVIADGSAWGAGQYKSSLGVDQLVNATSPLRYHVRWCDMRILISQPALSTDTQYIIPGTQPVNMITLNGIDFATADDSPVTGASNGCQTRPAIIPSGWRVATEISTINIMLLGGKYNFGTTCLVTAQSSLATSPATAGQVCNVPNSLVSVNTTSGMLVKPLSCSQRVLLSRTSNRAPTWALTPTITNQVIAGNLIFATLDNVAPEVSDTQCQNYALKLPAGWSIVNSTTSLTTLFGIPGTIFGSWCFVLSNGASKDRTSADCSGGLTDHLLNYNDGLNTYYAVKYCPRRILIVRNNVKATTFTVGMKIGVLTVTGNRSHEATLGAITTTLDSMDIPYDLVRVDSLPGGKLNMEDNLGNPLYYALVLTNDKLVADGQSVSSLNTANWNYLNNYKWKYNIRLFSAFSYLQTAEYNMTMPNDGSSANVYLRFDSSASAQTIATTAGMNPTGTVLLSNIWHYKSQIKNGATNVSPILRFTTTGVSGTSDPVAAVIVKKLDGTEEMHWFFDSADWTLHGMLYGPVWLKWITRGTFVGTRRVYFSCQVDDVFLSTETWAGHPNLTGPAVRMNGKELTFLNNWQINLNTKVLPAGSNFTLEMAFNGVGTMDPEVGTLTDSLYVTAKSLRDRFYWLSHTYTHLDLTCPESNCTEYGTTTYEDAYYEMNENIKWANTYLFADQNFTRYSSKSMVTPKISGLFNPNALQAIKINGVGSVVGDNTRPDLQAENWYHGFYVGEGIFVIPRFATRIGFDNHIPAETESQHNYIYGPQGVQPYYNHNLTFSEILTIERDRVVPYLLSYRHDPYMFHQANLVLYKSGKNDTTLISSWVDIIAKAYANLMKLPVLSLKQDDLFRYYLERRARKDCGVVAKMTVNNCKGTSINLASSGSCRVGITGLTSGGQYERYGPDDCIFAQMSANSASIPLASPTVC